MFDSLYDTVAIGLARLWQLLALLPHSIKEARLLFLGRSIRSQEAHANQVAWEIFKEDVRQLKQGEKELAKALSELVTASSKRAAIKLHAQTVARMERKRLEQADPVTSPQSQVAA